VVPGETTDMMDGGSKTWTLKNDELFVMGDHRQESQDSRDFGPISRSSVIGRAWIRYWPASAFGLVPQAKQQPSPSGSPVPSTTP
jgi:signal peptidase I